MRGLLALASIAMAASATAQERGFQPPTATEVFNLRSRCVELADKMVQEFWNANNVSQWARSHYDPRTNRCYVEFNVEKKALYVSRSLFDGQTKDVIAFAEIYPNNKRSGKVYDRQHKPTSLDNDGWDDANKYIDEMMAEDRR